MRARHWRAGGRTAGRTAGRTPGAVLVVLVTVVLVVGVAAVVASGVGRSDRGPVALAGAPGTHTIEVAGRDRVYRVRRPSVPAPAAGYPVVVVLHGGGGTGEQIEQQSGMTTAADAAGFVAVYPDGTGRFTDRLLTWNAYGCCGYASDQGVDDVAFVTAMLDELVSTQPVDPSRIYVTGLSNGAMMTYRLACELSDRVAAVAVVAGALDTDSCAPTRPVPVLVVHGTDDHNVRYDGGPSAAGPVSERGRVDRPVSFAVNFWASRDGCPATPTRARQGDQGQVVVTTYAPCDAGTQVVLYTVEGGGHAWPGGQPGWRGADPPPPQPDASTVALNFFADYRLN